MPAQVPSSRRKRTWVDGAGRPTEPLNAAMSLRSTGFIVTIGEHSVSP